MSTLMACVEIDELRSQLNSALAMLDEILALDDVESPGPEESVASVVHDAMEHLRGSRDFYRRRCEALQKWQARMRDPERTIVCDILANGSVDQVIRKHEIKSLETGRWGGDEGAK